MATVVQLCTEEQFLTVTSQNALIAAPGAMAIVSPGTAHAEDIEFEKMHKPCTRSSSAKPHSRHRETQTATNT